MCGRYVVTKAVFDLLPDLVGDVPPFDDDYNVAPTALVPIVRARGETREVVLAHWGFLPAWAKDSRAKPQPINARIETVETSGMFRRAFARARCIVPALGYYEWTATPTGKQPHFIYEQGLHEQGIHQPGIHAPGAQPPGGRQAWGALAMAGVVSAWADPAVADDDPARWRLSVAIITRDAHVAPGEVHDRMPACLTPDAADAWLDPTTAPVEAMAVLQDASLRIAARLQHNPVSRAVNAVRNNGPQLIRPIPDA